MGEYTDKAKGKIKQAVGEVTGNASLKREGERDEAKGQLEGAVKDVKHAVKGAVHDMKETAKDAKDAVKDAVK